MPHAALVHPCTSRRNCSRNKFRSYRDIPSPAGSGGGCLAGGAGWQAGVLGEDFLAPGAALVGVGGILAPVSFVGPGLFRLVFGNELVFAVANEVCPAHLFECLAQQWPVVRVMVAQQGLVQFALFGVLDGFHRVTFVADFLQRVFAGVDNNTLTLIK